MNSRKNEFVVALVAVFVLAQFGAAAQDDRATFGLKGNVTRVKYNSDLFQGIPFSFSTFGNEELEFTKSGRLVMVNGSMIKDGITDYGVSYSLAAAVPVEDDYYLDVYFMRDARGRIAKIISDELGIMGYDTIIYDSRGRVVQINTFTYVGADYDIVAGKEEPGRYVGNRRRNYFYDAPDNVIRMEGYDSEKGKQQVDFKYVHVDSSGNWLIRVRTYEDDGIKNAVEKRTLEY